MKWASDFIHYNRVFLIFRQELKQPIMSKNKDSGKNNKNPELRGAGKLLPRKEGGEGVNLDAIIKKGEENKKKTFAEKAKSSTSSKPKIKPQKDFDKKGWEKVQQQKQAAIDKRVEAAKTIKQQKPQQQKTGGLAKLKSMFSKSKPTSQPKKETTKSKPVNPMRQQKPQQQKTKTQTTIAKPKAATPKSVKSTPSKTQASISKPNLQKSIAALKAQKTKPATTKATPVKGTTQPKKSSVPSKGVEKLKSTMKKNTPNLQKAKPVKSKAPKISKGR